MQGRLNLKWAVCLMAALLMAAMCTGASATAEEITWDDIETYANDLYETYGIGINAMNEMNGVQEYGKDTLVYPEPDEEVIMAGMRKLDDLLAEYPPTFFEQLSQLLKEDGYEYGIGITLCGRIQADSSYRYGMKAFVHTHRFGLFEMVLNVNNFDLKTFVHESGHILDNAIVSKIPSFYEDWEKMNPEGFEYKKNYQNEVEFDNREYARAFVSAYSMMTREEDSAEILGHAAAGEDYWFQEGRPVKQKLQYYSDAIRTVFDTTGWPEETLWEKSLHTTAVLPEITTTELPAAAAGQQYSVQLEAKGDRPISWYVLSDEWPEWLELSVDGRLSGVPDVPGAYPISVWADGMHTGDWMDYVVRVESAAVQPTVPKTGDAAYPFVWMVLSALALFGAVRIVRLKKAE